MDMSKLHQRTGQRLPDRAEHYLRACDGPGLVCLWTIYPGCKRRRRS